MNKNFRSVLLRGASLLEALLAIGLLSSLAPFVLKSVNKQTATTRNIALAKEIENVIYAVSNYMDAHLPVHSERIANSPAIENIPQLTSGQVSFSSLLSDYGLDSNLTAIYSLFDEIHLVMNKKEDSVNGYFILSGGNMEPIYLQEVAAMIGPSAGVVDEGSIYGMAHNWNMSTDSLLPGSNKVSSGLVVQISRGAGRVDVYLNRVVPEKAVMYTNIYMGRTNRGKCETDDKVDSVDSKGRLIDFKLINTGVAEVQSVIQSFENRGSYQELEGKINGIDIPQFKVSDVTEIDTLTINKFVVPDPSHFIQPDDGSVLKMNAKIHISSLADVASSLNLDPSKNSYIGFNVKSIFADRSSLKVYTDKSPVRNIQIANLYAKKVQTNKLLYEASVFNPNSIIRAQELRTPIVTWGAYINAGAIITGEVLYGKEDDNKLIDKEGKMYIPNFEILSFNPTGDSEVSTKELKDIVEKIHNTTIETCTKWQSKLKDIVTGQKSKCIETLGITVP